MGEEGHAMTPGATIPGLAGTVSSTTSPSTSPSTSPPASLHPSNPPSSSRSHLHAHRQSHNSSKLPAFRFADRDLNKQQSLPLPTLPQPSEQSQLSSAPVSPNSGVIDLDAPPSGIYLSDNMTRGGSTGSRRSSRSSNSSSSSSHSASQPPNSMHVSGVASAGLRNHPPRTTSKSTRSSRHSGRDSPNSGGGAPAGAQDHSQSPREIKNTTRIGTSNSIPRMTTHHAQSSQQHQHHNQQQPAQDTRQTSTSYPPRTRFSKRDSIPEDQELSPPRTRPRSRASTLQTSPQPTFATTPATSSSTRPSSLPHSPAAAGSREHASPDVAGAAETPSAGAKTQHRRAPASHNQSRVTRSSHRRPLSVAVPSSYQSTSPPRVTRRLSDQQETSRSRSRLTDDRDAAEAAVRDLPYRGYRNSPTTPRSLAFQDSPADSSSYSRRRTSVTDSNPGPASRNSAYRQSHLAYGHPRTFNSSPLASRQAEPHRHDTHHEGSQGIEGTESTASTTAPSTVWDELDDLKSRIHRLELTGKLPSTSSAAIHKVLDERPATATNTTVSTSPKHNNGNATVLGDASSTTSSQREAQPLLFSAINRTKPLLSAEVSKALETAATEAVALVVMMGTAGQPGPISSGASTIGAGTNLTDRQLRRRAEGVCRSLTELVLALSEEATQPQNKTVTIKTSGSPQKEGPTTPTITKSFPRLDIQRRGSVTNNDAPATTNEPSPRAMSKLEERRSTMLNSTALPSPRFALAPPVSSTPTEASHGVARKSSLFIGRTRRAATEEPEEGRRSSMLLRTRRAGTEEPEEGRKTSLLRERRGTNEHDDDEPRFRAPSRAQTEVAQNRAASHHFQTQPPTLDPSSNNSALPRRRIGSSALNPSRLASPSTPSALGGRRYFERSTPDRDGNSVADKLAEERGQRHLSLGQNSLLNRTASFLRRPNRESMANASTSAQTGGYR
ncbi:hypothetical protein BN1723_011381 [Verticillium longisporum]|uniref:LPXTG-motif cell wall anchor domain protein n=1 Tax=Verticillium longisporum TaxID=100787 RepID=A0A0G4L6K0_VERLO|nr:hypothetical protein BN1723_011381 [Verticillium longisporum]